MWVNSGIGRFVSSLPLSIDRESEMAYTPSIAVRSTAACPRLPTPASTAIAAAGARIIVGVKRNIVHAKGPSTNALILVGDPATLEQAAPPPRTQDHLGRRPALSACFTALTLSLSGAGFSYAAILEADDDEELLERVKKDRKKRLERQGFLSSSDKETGYLQELVYKLSKVGQAIEKNDLSAASSVLGRSTNADWVQNVNTAFTKLSSSPEEKIEVSTFNSSLVYLFTSVNKGDVESSRMAFVSSAVALEKWIGSTGLIGQIKGL